jgi:hemoglobin
MRNALPGRSLTVLTAFVLVLLSEGVAVGQPATGDASLYERIGELPAISLVTSDFVDAFIQDPVILANPAVRERKTPESAPYVKYQVTTLICQATGGPCQYTGLDMAEAHRGLNVSEREWDRMVTIFSQTLDRHGVPAREQGELFEILGPTKDDIVVSNN